MADLVDQHPIVAPACGVTSGWATNVSPARSFGVSHSRSASRWLLGSTATRGSLISGVHLQILLVERRVQKGDVHAAVAQRRDHFRELDGADIDPDPRMAATESREQR